jgi:hypothetical protein
MRIRLRSALHRCVGGYNFRELTVQREKGNVPSAKDKCDTRSSLLIPKIGAFDCIGYFLPYLNKEQGVKRVKALSIRK